MALFKTCCTCHLLLPISDFNRRAVASDGLQSRCRSCCREWYLANKSAHKVRARERNLAVRTALAIKVAEYLFEHPCVDCSERDIRVLDFDHRDRSEKTYAVSAMIALQMSWAAILVEIAKCDVRCANCHRRRTAVQLSTIRQSLMERNDPSRA